MKIQRAQDQKARREERKRRRDQRKKLETAEVEIIPQEPTTKVAKRSKSVDRKSNVNNHLKTSTNGPLVFRRKDGADKVQEAVKPIDEGILVVKNIEKVKKLRGEGKLVYRQKN